MTDIDPSLSRVEGDEDEGEECPTCGERGGDPCDCIDCGTLLCCNCAEGGRCDDCDCEVMAEDSEQ